MDRLASARRPRARWLAGWLALGALAALVCAAAQEEEQLLVESRQQKEAAASENELADTIKYLEKLEKLDNYWSEKARPRYGRSAYKQRRANFRLWPQQVQPEVLAARRGPDPSLRPLLDLVNARLAQRYNSDAAY